MAASPVRVYAMGIWGAQKIIARKLGGTEIKRLPLNDRVVLITVDIVLGMILQALVTAGILTDVAIQTRIDAISNATFPRLPDSVPADDEDLGTVAPDPDLGNV